MNAKDHGISVRSREIGILEAGATQKIVAKELGVGERRWWSTYKTQKSLESKPKSGRPPSFKREAKIIISKSLGERR